MLFFAGGRVKRGEPGKKNGMFLIQKQPVMRK